MWHKETDSLIARQQGERVVDEDDDIYSVYHLDCKLSVSSSCVYGLENELIVSSTGPKSTMSNPIGLGNQGCYLPE